MILLLYNLLLLAALVLGSPWWLVRVMTTEKYREGLRQRLGLDVLRAEGDVVWVHAVSVGEVLAVSRLVAELRAAMPDVQVYVSTTTRTGQALARARFGAEKVFYCPLDVPWAVTRWMNALRPKMLVLAETEFWPNMLSACARRGVTVAVVNARISDRSYPRYKALRSVWRPFLRRLNCVLAQTTLDAERLCEIGCEPGRVQVAGNLKFDIRATEESKAARLLAEYARARKLVVAGSTLEGEEAALLEMWPELMRAVPEAALVIAPRHPERFDGVAELLYRSGLAWQRRSEGLRDVEAGSVVLLDSIGELATVYARAAVAFVGGSLMSGGGHNPLEAAQFAVPVVMGESVENFRAIVEVLMRKNAIKISKRDELGAVLREMLIDVEAARLMGERARAVFEAEAGATERCLAALRMLMERAA